ncbi:MAG: phosphoglucosamine mutase [Candidatus Omnitrophota bacterium]
MAKTPISKDKLFGTDGIRGTPGVYPLTDGMLFKIGSGIGHYVSSISPTRRTKKLKVLIGKDTRLSGEQLESILADSLKEQGIDVSLVGIITTPGLSFLTADLKADVGIMISASHNKATDNGIKFFNAKGFKFSPEEENQIEDIIFNTLMRDVDKENLLGLGKITKTRNAQPKYVKFLASTLEGSDLSGLRIALDCAFGAACPFGKKLFQDLGAEVHSIHDTPHGHNINVGGAINPDFLKALVLKEKADIGIAVDGDGDRGILVDEKGNILDGDFTIAIMAKYLLEKNRLPKNTLVTTVMCNYGLRAFLQEIGAEIHLTDVGDKHVLEALLKNNLNLGGEQSGHIIFLDYLSTPDGLLTALQVLKVMKDTDCSLSELSKCITKYPQILVNIKVKEKVPFEKMPSVTKKLQQGNEQLKDKGRILLRYSGTEDLARVMVEGKDKNAIHRIAHSIAREIRQEIGIDE